MKDRERLMAKAVPDESGCLVWVGSTSPQTGYGFFVLSGRVHSAHRASFLLFKGPIPEGMQVMHSCDVRACVNPDHLSLGTHRDNMADMVRKGRQCRGVRVKQSKLTPEKVREIRRRHAAGEPQNSLAREFGVSAASLNDVVHHKTWRHI